MSNLDLARKALHAFSSGDMATMNTLMADDFQFLGVTPQPLGKPEYLGFMSAINTAFPDFKFEEVSASESGDTVTIKHHITGTQTGPLNLPGMPSIPATGKKMRLPEETSVFTFAGSKVSKYLGEPAPDGGLPGMLKQLGVELPH
jgi:predicted ester cyclase